MAQWWEHSPPTNVAGVSVPDSASHVDWVCWFSTLQRDVFSGYSSFPSPQKPTFDLICVNLLISVYSVLNKCSSAITTRHLNKVPFLSFTILEQKGDYAQSGPCWCNLTFIFTFLWRLHFVYFISAYTSMKYLYLKKYYHTWLPSCLHIFSCLRNGIMRRHEIWSSLTRLYPQSYGKEFSRDQEPITRSLSMHYILESTFVRIFPFLELTLQQETHICMHLHTFLSSLDDVRAEPKNSRRSKNRKIRAKVDS